MAGHVDSNVPLETVPQNPSFQMGGVVLFLSCEGEILELDGALMCCVRERMCEEGLERRY